jgi:mRNA interferase YafQ
LTIKYTTQFKKDYKRIKKQGKDLEQLRIVITKLATGEKLELKYKDHGLTGSLKGYRDCHVEPDWLLIYKLIGDRLLLERTGSHSELFN